MFNTAVLQAQSGISPYNPLVVAIALVSASAIIAGLYLYREARGTHSPEDHRSFAWLFGLFGAMALLISGEIFWAN